MTSDEEEVINEGTNLDELFDQLSIKHCNRLPKQGFKTIDSEKKVDTIGVQR